MGGQQKGDLFWVHGQTKSLYSDGIIAGPLPLRSAGNNNERTSLKTSSGYKRIAQVLYLIKDKFCLAHPTPTFTV